MVEGARFNRERLSEAASDEMLAATDVADLLVKPGMLFGPPGHAYAYRSDGIHALRNAVAGQDGVGAAVLIRAIEPLEGIEVMRARRRVGRDEELTNGPGKLTEALGIGLDLNGVDLGNG